MVNTVKFCYVMLPAYACIRDLSLPAPFSTASASRNVHFSQLHLACQLYSAKCDAAVHTACASRGFVAVQSCTCPCGQAEARHA